MGNKDTELFAKLKELFASQLLAVLGTHSEGGPYTCLICYAATDDLDRIVFATGRSTRKFANLTADPRASLLIDNRCNETSDLRNAMAVTALGSVREVDGAERDELGALLLTRNPALEEFVASPSCALIELRVKSYYAVQRFQQVMEWHLDS